ncbi:MAG TPA: DNA primase [Patescibacteria group bacterium]|nr:DNA primase [Patescibacteria group bacterium]
MNQSEEIKEKLDIVDIIRDYVPLKASGSNFKANCPFHNEKTASFMVSPEKQIYHCFGCGRGGDVFKFIMEMEGLDFVETLKLLAPKAGVTLEQKNYRSSSKKSRLLEIMELASKYFEKSMHSTDNGKQVLAYLKERGLTDDTIKYFKLGYSQRSWDDVLNFLKEKKYREDEIFSAGITKKKENSSHYYNRFRNRIMFPIFDISGHAIAFTARVNPYSQEDEKMGKYINSPETEIYYKSKVLYGIDRAKMDIKKQDFAIVVEGQMDVIMSHQEGFSNTIASSGTALGSEQLKIIKRYTNNLYLAFDMDKAGQMAVDRGIKEALEEEMNIKIILLPEGKDPADLLKKDKSLFAKAVKEAKNMMEYYIEKILFEYDISKIDEKKLASAKIMTLLNKIKNDIEKDYWTKVISEKLDISETVLREFLNSRKTGKTVNYQKKEEKNIAMKNLNNQESRLEKISKSILSIILKFPEFVDYVISNLDKDLIVNEKKRQFYNHLIIYYNDNKSLNFQEFNNWLKTKSEEMYSLVPELVLLGENDFFHLSQAEAQKELVHLISLNKDLFKQEQKKIIQKKISEAEKAEDSEEVNRLLKELKTLSAQN